MSGGEEYPKYDDNYGYAKPREEEGGETYPKAVEVGAGLCPDCGGMIAQSPARLDGCPWCRRASDYATELDEADRVPEEGGPDALEGQQKNARAPAVDCPRSGGGEPETTRPSERRDQRGAPETLGFGADGLGRTPASGTVRPDGEAAGDNPPPPAPEDELLPTFDSILRQLHILRARIGFLTQENERLHHRLDKAAHKYLELERTIAK